MNTSADTIKFWSFVESWSSKSEREDWAVRTRTPNVLNEFSACTVRGRAHETGLVKAEWIYDEKGVSEASGETAEAESESGSEGVYFERLRDMFLLEDSVEDEDEDVAENGRMEEQVGNDSLELVDPLKLADSNDPKTEASQQPLEHNVRRDEILARRESRQPSEHNVRIDENLARQESRQPSTTVRQVWEWSQCDADAEHSLRLRDKVMAEPPIGIVTPPPEVESVWEWTRYDSEAEREEVRRVSASRGVDDETG